MTKSGDSGAGCGVASSLLGIGGTLLVVGMRGGGTSVDCCCGGGDGSGT